MKFVLPEDIIRRAPSAITEYTFRTMLPVWLDNLAENLPAIRAGLDAEDLPKRKEPCLIIGAGPSLKHFKHLDLIKKSGWKHPILACDRILNDCLAKKMTPYTTATVDGSPKVHGFFTKPLVKKHAPQINGLFNCVTHPLVVKTWQRYGGKVYWFVSMFDLPTKEGKLDPHSLSYALHLLTKGKGLISGMGNVGSFLWNMAYALNCDPIILVGMDFSEQVKDVADAVYFDHFTKMFLAHQKCKETDVGLAMDMAAGMHAVETNPDFTSTFSDAPYYVQGQHPRYLINPVWKFYRDTLALHIKSSGRHTINCTGNGCIHTKATDDDGNLILDCPNFEARLLEEVLTTYA